MTSSSLDNAASTRQLVGLFAPPPSPPPLTLNVNPVDANVGETSVGETPVGETPVGETCAEISVGETSVVRRESSLTERTSLLLDADSSHHHHHQGGADVFAAYKALRSRENSLQFDPKQKEAEQQQHQQQQQQQQQRHGRKSAWWKRITQQHPLLRRILKPTTIAGALMFLLYHVVFVLAFGSALMRPHAASSSGDGGANPMLGVLAKLATVGIFSAGPVYIYRLNADIPAVYPSVDLFLAPFLAQAAALVDASLWEQQQQQGQGGPYPDALFLGSFAVLTSIGMGLAGLFLFLGSTFKLANLGTYLPYSVLSGFFSAVGVLLWCLAFAVDTSGKTWKDVFGSGDVPLILDSCLHHLPSLVIGILMNKLGPKNPFFVIMLLVVTQITFYTVMWVTGTSLSDAQRAQWFWSVHELVYHPIDHESAEMPTSMVPSWALPPAPFGSFGAILAGHVNWTAVRAGLGNMVALAFLYLLRSSIHASAMKKNVSNLVMRIPRRKEETVDFDDPQDAEVDISATIVAGNMRPSTRRTSATTILESVRQSVRIINMSMQDRKPIRQTNRFTVAAGGPLHNTTTPSESSGRPAYTEIRAKAPRRSLESIFSEYAYTLFVVAGFGGFAVCPTVATSNTMYAIGADDAAPQYGSILLLIVFYLLDFRMVQYIPKTAFSSLLVLGAVDTLVVWFFGAFHKTQDLAEWLVVPLIAGFSLFVGFLNAVFLGIGISMFVFVAAFFRVGVVKYNATGIEIRSRIERSMEQSLWLHENGDLLQVMVLQNYLFFGNACTILAYISTMFEAVDETQSQRLDFSIAPIPKIVVLDLSLVTGMDTSTNDIFAEIFEFCKNNDCKLFLCGLSLRMKRGLELGGVKPESGPRSKSSVRFFTDLDTALGRAEDALLDQSEVQNVVEPQRIGSPDSHGFRRALKQIDKLHGQEFAHGLLGFEAYTEFLVLEPGQRLYQCDGGVVEDSRRGLFFIEDGLLKIERDSTQSLTLTRTRGSIAAGSRYTLKNQHARMGTVAQRAALVKQAGAPSGNLRLARLGPGWVCGTLDMASGVRASGITVAVTQCRLYHLSFAKLEEIEKEDPALVLRLYKLMTHLRAHREEATIEQLSTLSNIMSSPAHSKPISRAARHALSPYR